MKLEFLTTKQMTTEQTQAIDTALQAHGIDIDDEKYETLCQCVNEELEFYIRQLPRDRPDSKAKTIKQIEDLQYALRALRPTARHILHDMVNETDIGRTMTKSGITNVMFEQLDLHVDMGRFNKWVSDDDGNLPHASLYGFCLNVLQDACNLVLKKEEQEVVKWMCSNRGINYKPEATIEKHIPNIKGGRPIDECKRSLAGVLAEIFEKGTGRRATETESGAFDDFLSACLAVVEPAKETGATNRKLIRAALEHVPKPRRNK